MSPAPTTTVEARCVRLDSKAENAAAIAPVVERHALTRGPNDLLIEVKAAAVNPADIPAVSPERMAAESVVRFWNRSVPARGFRSASPVILVANGTPPGWWWMSAFGAGFSCHGALLKAS